MKKIKKLYSVDFLKDDVIALIKQGVRARHICSSLKISYNTYTHVRDKYRNLWESNSERILREWKNQYRKDKPEAIKAQKQMWREYAESLNK